ncbi:MAG: hypothetical protein KatS3mg077_0768 [Candidatus Binatia bacterium]|nr:MAG: hypothetical protein KatS3mg077_0768 [Candidatus Binatia bacterium]
MKARFHRASEHQRTLASLIGGFGLLFACAPRCAGQFVMDFPANEDQPWPYFAQHVVEPVKASDAIGAPGARTRVCVAVRPRFRCCDQYGTWYATFSLRFRDLRGFSGPVFCRLYNPKLDRWSLALRNSLSWGERKASLLPARLIPAKAPPRCGRGFFFPPVAESRHRAKESRGTSCPDWCAPWPTAGGPGCLRNHLLGRTS